MMFPKLFDNINWHNSRRNSPVQKAHPKILGSNNTVNINHQILQGQSVDEREKLISQLRHQWLLSNDGITSARMAGLEWGNGEKDWLNQQLSSRGLSWHVE